jgi:hypothetical protein
MNEAINKKHEIKTKKGTFVWPVPLGEIETSGNEMILPTLREMGELFEALGGTTYGSDCDRTSVQFQDFVSLLNGGTLVRHTLMCGLPQKQHNGIAGAVQSLTASWVQELRDEGLAVVDALPDSTRENASMRVADIGEQFKFTRMLQNMVRISQLGCCSDPPTRAPLIAAFFDHRKKDGCFGASIKNAYFFEYYNVPSGSPSNYYALWALVPEEHGDYWVVLKRNDGPPPIAADMSMAYRNDHQTSHLLIEPHTEKPSASSMVVGFIRA